MPPPAKPEIFFIERFAAARHDEGCYGKITFSYFLVYKGLSNDDVGVARGVARGAEYQEVRPGAGFQTGDSATEKLGGLP